MLVPLLLQALYKYNLVSAFSEVVAGFCNTPEAISELGDKARITSLSLRSLCKTVLEDTSLSTASAVDRSRVLVSIMVRVTGGGAGVSVDKIVKFSNTVSSEETQLKFLKNVLGTQVRNRLSCLILGIYNFDKQLSLLIVNTSKIVLEIE